MIDIVEGIFRSNDRLGVAIKTLTPCYCSAVIKWLGRGTKGQATICAAAAEDVVETDHGFERTGRGFR